MTQNSLAVLSRYVIGIYLFIGIYQNHRYPDVSLSAEVKRTAQIYVELKKIALKIF